MITTIKLIRTGIIIVIIKVIAVKLKFKITHIQKKKKKFTLKIRWPSFIIQLLTGLLLPISGIFSRIKDKFHSQTAIPRWNKKTASQSSRQPLCVLVSNLHHSKADETRQIVSKQSRVWKCATKVSDQGQGTQYTQVPLRERVNMRGGSLRRRHRGRERQQSRWIKRNGAIYWAWIKSHVLPIKSVNEICKGLYLRKCIVT